MSFTVEQHHVVQYGRNVEMILQQGGRKLSPYVQMGTYTGKSGVVVDQIGTTVVVRNRMKHTDTPHLSIPGDRRWVYPNSLTWATLIDNFDNIRVLIDLKSNYATAGANAMARAEDDEIGAAFFAPAMTGENGTVSVAFPGTQIVGANVGGTASGLNVPKLRAAKRLLMAAGSDLANERAYIAITSVEHDNLLGELQVTSTDYNDRPVLVDGRVTSFMGFNFVHVEWQATQSDGVTPTYPLSLPYIVPGGTASTTRNIPCWVESGMHMGRWGGLENKVDQRPDKNYNWQIWMEQNVGVTRTQEKKVVEIVCTSA